MGGYYKDKANMMTISKIYITGLISVFVVSILINNWCGLKSSRYYVILLLNNC